MRYPIISKFIPLGICLVLASAALPSVVRGQIVTTQAPTEASTGSCSGSLNLGLDYFLRTQLFANLTQIDLPAEIPLPLSAFKITNLKLAGLAAVSRGCSLRLDQVGLDRLRLRACALASRVRASFALRLGSTPLDFVSAVITDTGVSAQASAKMVPGGFVELEAFDMTLGGIVVENTGLSGSLLTRVMRLSSVREKLRSVIVAGVSAKISEVLRKNPLPR